MGSGQPVDDWATMRGVDSLSLHISKEALPKAMAVSEDFRCSVVVTRQINYVIDTAVGRMQSIKGGHRLMGEVTGTGCSLGSTIAAYLALGPKSQSFLQTYHALGNYNAAGYKASCVIKHVPYSPPEIDTIEASGSFQAAFLDSLSYISMERVSWG